MKISKEEVNYIARLAKLRLTDQQSEKMAREFEDILEHFKSIDNIDLEAVGLKESEDNIKTVLRKDQSVLYGNHKKLFSNVKSMRDRHIQVPKIIE